MGSLFARDTLPPRTGPQRVDGDAERVLQHWSYVYTLIEQFEDSLGCVALLETYITNITYGSPAALVADSLD